MKINGIPYKTIWYDNPSGAIFIIDQTRLPHRFEVIGLNSLQDFCKAIATMQVRGAPLIGVTAAFGLALELLRNPSMENEAKAAIDLLATRPTAVNLQWAIERMRYAVSTVSFDMRGATALSEAQKILDEDIAKCADIGEHGLKLLESIYQEKTVQSPLNILTHCNAGWLATVDWGTALAPIYKAHESGIPIHVWVDETRPRNQGASLTAWELSQQGIEHTVIADNTGGHLMQNGLVDCCIVGSDRTTAKGDVCNKIGTYLKALAAYDNNIPFYVALPSSTIDWKIDDGIKDIAIEQRDSREVTHVSGLDKHGQITEVQLTESPADANFAFDVTPAKFISALITEFGLFDANVTSLKQLKQLLAPSDFISVNCV
ncbi:MAG: methylthioribose-1-phosphate isomerase [Oceanicoccus sp.]|jgi:methylthioribose-1-phosphate isomerase